MEPNPCYHWISNGNTNYRGSAAPLSLSSSSSSCIVFSFLSHWAWELSRPAHIIWETSLENLFIWERYYYRHSPWERVHVPQASTTPCMCVCVHACCACMCTVSGSHNSSNDFCSCQVYKAGNHLRLSKAVWRCSWQRNWTPRLSYKAT